MVAHPSTALCYIGATNMLACIRILLVVHSPPASPAHVSHASIAYCAARHSCIAQPYTRLGKSLLGKVWVDDKLRNFTPIGSHLLSQPKRDRISRCQPLQCAEPGPCLVRLPLPDPGINQATDQRRQYDKGMH